MSEFVEQCRAEWRRLGVADPLAEEMAADLTSDLDEAEAEGVSAGEYLGSSASDARSFAASWAAERGVIPAPSRAKGRRTPLALVVFTAVAAIAVVVAALLLATGEPKVTLTARTTQSHLRGGLAPPSSTVHQVQASAAAPIEWILLFVAIAALGFAVWLWLRWSRYAVLRRSERTGISCRYRAPARLRNNLASLRGPAWSPLGVSSRTLAQARPRRVAMSSRFATIAAC
jgi:hypothetical protein